MSWPIGECVNGVLIDYRPQPDDPEFAVVVGDCPLWPVAAARSICRGRTAAMNRSRWKKGVTTYDALRKGRPSNPWGITNGPLPRPNPKTRARRQPAACRSLD